MNILIKQEIKREIANGRLKEAIVLGNKRLLKNESLNNDIKNSFICISGDYYSLMHLNLTGTTTYENYVYQENKIKMRYLELLQVIDNPLYEKRNDFLQSHSVSKFDEYSLEIDKIISYLSKNENLIISIKEKINHRVIKIKQSKNRGKIEKLELEIRSLNQQLKTLKESYNHLLEKYKIVQIKYNIRDDFFENRIIENEKNNMSEEISIKPIPLIAIFLIKINNYISTIISYSKETYKFTINNKEFVRNIGVFIFCTSYILSNLFGVINLSPKKDYTINKKALSEYNCFENVKFLKSEISKLRTEIMLKNHRQQNNNSLLKLNDYSKKTN